MKLSEHFELSEFIVSRTADRLGIDNTPNDEVIANLKSLCNNVLEPLRTRLGKPVKILSGFRCDLLNKAVGGSKTSQHPEGKAVDIDVEDMTTTELYNWIKANGGLPIDQMISEFPNSLSGGWVHLSHAEINRGEYLIANKENGKTIYTADFI